MKNNRLTTQRFWRDALLATVAVVGLAALQPAANVIFALPHGRLPARLIRVMGSRTITVNAGLQGYYEQLLSPAGAPHKRQLTTEEYFRWANGSHDRIYSPDFRIARLRPNLERQLEGAKTEQPTNRFGFSGVDWSLQKPPSTRRVALLGDSMAQGMGVDLNHTFGALLEHRLNSNHSGGASQRFEVLNFAVTGYPLTQVFDVAMEDVPRFKPDLYMLALTDLFVAGDWDRHLVQVIQFGIDPKYDFLRETLRRAKVSKVDDRATLSAKLEPFRIPLLREMLLEIKSRAAQDHASFIVVLLPALEDGDLSRKRLSEVPGILESLHITFVDLLDTFDEISDLDPLRLDPDNVHPNPRGHAMIAENLYTKLQAQPEVWSALVGN
jgi:lysophospholipase L1-like esterase